MYPSRTFLFLLLCLLLPSFSLVSMATGGRRLQPSLDQASSYGNMPYISDFTKWRNSKARGSSEQGMIAEAVPEGIYTEGKPQIPEGIGEEKAEFIRWLLPQIEQAREEVGNLISISIPNSLIVAQAALESGWGTSFGAKKRRNLFGLTKGNGQGMKFSSSLEGLKKYMFVLDQNPAYFTLREKLEETTNPLELTKHLTKYCECRDYSAKLNQIIKQNRLAELDI